MPQKTLFRIRSLIWVLVFSVQMITAQTAQTKIKTTRSNAVHAGASAFVSKLNISERKKLVFDDHVKYRFSEGLCAIQRNQQWGFIDTLGNVVIDFKYSCVGFEAPCFRDGICSICERLPNDELKRICIDKKGNSLFADKGFYAVTTFSKGIAIAERINQAQSSSLSFIDTLGLPVLGAIVPDYFPGMKLEFRGFQDGLAAVCDPVSKGWGYVNGKGRWALLPQTKYRTVGDFHEGLAFVQENVENKWGAINTKGELVIPFMYVNRPADFSGGLAAVKNSEEKVGYINSKGDLVIPYRYDCIVNEEGLPFIDGYAIVNRDGVYYSVSATGKEQKKIGDSTAEVRMLQNGLVLHKEWLESGIWGIGIARTNGEIVCAPNTIYEMGEFGNGLAYAKASIDGVLISGFINLKGDFVILQDN
jgi:hypothetical protein